MGFTPEQIKGRIKSVAKQNNADARTLMRIYMMERFLERLAQSEYRDNFIIKGGILVTAMIGVAHRSTMDIDTSMKNLNLSAEDALRVVNQVKDIDLDDGVSFEVKDVSNIMDEMEYKLLPLVPQDENFKELVKEVRAVREQSVICPSALPEANVPELLEKIIKEKAYKQDYDSLTTQLLEENVPYDTVIATLKKVAESSIFENN